MSQATGAGEPPIVSSVLHPTDFSPASERAFAHALAVAVLRQARITLLHVSQGAVEESWSGFPGVRDTLARWKLLEPGSPRSAVLRDLGVRVEKVSAKSSDPVEAIRDRLEHVPVDLIVLATEGRAGVPRWLKGSVAERVARSAAAVTLFVPRDGRSFVAVDDGRISLTRILVPVGRSPRPDAAIVYASRLARVAGDGGLVIDLLHVGDDSDFPPLSLPEHPSYRFERHTRSGDVVAAITDFAERTQPDLVAMVTQGPDGLGDVLRGTTTEQVMRRAGCPLLAVPSDWGNGGGRT